MVERQDGGKAGVQHEGGCCGRHAGIGRDFFIALSEFHYAGKIA